MVRYPRPLWRRSFHGLYSCYYELAFHYRYLESTYVAPLDYPIQWLSCIPQDQRYPNECRVKQLESRTWHQQDKTMYRSPGKTISLEKRYCNTVDSYCNQIDSNFTIQSKRTIGSVARAGGQRLFFGRTHAAILPPVRELLRVLASISMNTFC